MVTQKPQNAGQSGRRRGLSAEARYFDSTFSNTLMTVLRRVPKGWVALFAMITAWAAFVLLCAGIWFVLHR